MAEGKKFEIELDSSFQISLERIEFPSGDEEFDREGNKRVVFIYRLHFDEGWTNLPVTMTNPAETLDDLREMSELQVYIMLGQLAETARRKAKSVHMVFVDSPD